MVVAVALACKKKKEPSPATVARAAELKPKVTQVLAQVASLSAKTKAVSPSAPALVLTAKPAFGTVSVLGEKFLEKPNSDNEELRIKDPVLSVCRYVVDQKVVQDDDIKSLEACARYEFAAVIRQSSYTQPDADEGTSYKPGSFSGDLLVFHLATGELRGLYSLSVSQDDQLELTSKPGEKPKAHEWRQQAIAYLEKNIRAEAEKQVQ